MNVDEDKTAASTSSNSQLKLSHVIFDFPVINLRDFCSSFLFKMKENNASSAHRLMETTDRLVLRNWKMCSCITFEQ